MPQRGACHCILNQYIAWFVTLCERDSPVAQRRIGDLPAKHVEQVIITAVNEPSGADAEGIQEAEFSGSVPALQDVGPVYALRQLRAVLEPFGLQHGAALRN